VGQKAYTCVSAVDVNQWQPSVPTTFVLSVYEIELILDNLKTIANPTLNTTNAGSKPNMTKYINNWESILKTYRSHNLDQASMFTQESLLMHSLVQSFSKFEAGMLSGVDFVNAFDNIAGSTSVPGNTHFTISSGDRQYGLFIWKLYHNKYIYIIIICFPFIQKKKKI
jgi:hypothetical protein